MAELTPDMARAALAFLYDAWPVQQGIEPGRNGWDHKFSTSYQISCMVLVALGEAEETPWGAVPLAAPRLPEVLPLWEDVAVAVLWLAGQQWLLSYRKMDGSPEVRRAGGFTVVRIGAPPPAPPNILAGPGSGPALAAPVVVTALEALGLVADGRWTAAAEPVLWRGMPGAWGLTFQEDARVLAAVEAALATLPGAMRDQIDALMRITEEAVSASLARNLAAREEQRLRLGREPTYPVFTAEMARRGLAFRREGDLDWLFFCHWRLGRGWLDEATAARALEVFHDRLAITVRRAVIGRLYPGGFVWD